jgi:hypothetical protein
LCVAKKGEGETLMDALIRIYELSLRLKSIKDVDYSDIIIARIMGLLHPSDRLFLQAIYPFEKSITYVRVMEVILAIDSLVTCTLLEEVGGFNPSHDKITPYHPHIVREVASWRVLGLYSSDFLGLKEHIKDELYECIALLPKFKKGLPIKKGKKEGKH